MRPATWCLVLTLAGCKGDGDDSGAPDSSAPSDSLPVVDADADGFAEDEDCDDADPSVHPEAAETCDDRDEDCDGAVDEGLDEATWYDDVDGDGHGDPETSLVACEAPEGWVDVADDCDDAEPSAWTGAEESCDGIDNDCDDEVDEVDEDGDGHVVPSCGGEDCDDADAEVHPDVDEICNNGVDDDCDGEAGDCELRGDVPLADSSDAVIYGIAPHDQAGEALAAPGDVDGDGYADILLGADGAGAGGAAYLVRGPVSGDLGLLDADLTFEGLDDSDRFGTSVGGAGDVNADGFPDLLVGAYGVDTIAYVGGAAYLLHGGDALDEDVSSAAAVLYGEGEWGYAGYFVGGAGDVDGDGYDDVLVGAWYYTHTIEQQGATYLVRGPVTGEHSLGDADVRFYGLQEGAYLGRSGAGAGDVDGDGLDDVLLSAFRADAPTGNDAGTVYVLLGPVPDGSTLDDADATYVGEDAGDYFGQYVGALGDTDGDGYDDVGVGAVYFDGTDHSLGAAYVFHGPMTASTFGARLTGERTGDQVGDSFAGVGDVDGDGKGDFLVGVEDDDQYDTNTGAAFLVYGPASGTSSVYDASAASLYGQSRNIYAGASVAGPGDLDGDGVPDLLVGAPGKWAGTVEDAGAVYLVRGTGM